MTQKDMVDLNIYLEEGFFEDMITIMVNGVKVYHKKSVTTHAVLGLADSVTINISRGPTNIEIFLRNRNISKKIFLEILNTIHLAISVHDKTISHRLSEEPFTYM